MPRLTNKLPSYRRHKWSGRAVVTIAGRDHYLGMWNSPESRAEYDRLIAEWAANGRGRPARQPEAVPCDPSVVEVIAAFMKHAATHYRGADGAASQELENLKDAARPLKRLYGPAPARSFGPLALRALREDLIGSGLARSTINARINRVRRIFRWAVSDELIPPSVDHALGAVAGLQRGRTRAAEAKAIVPVPIAAVDATIPHLPRPVAAMVRLQLLTGCRPGEVMAMRGCDLTPGDPVWEYRPGRHKNEWRGHARVIPLGPQAREVVPHDNHTPGQFLDQCFEEGRRSPIVEVAVKVSKNIPMRSRRGDSHRAAATETFSRWPDFWARTGVCPRGARVRRTNGAMSKPLSSINAR
jgi:integrase